VERLPIKFEKYSKIKEKKSKNDQELLLFMKREELYTTNQIQKFLDINHTATLGRLKKLKRDKFIKLTMKKRIYRWEKIKDIPEKQLYAGYKFMDK